MPVAVDEAAPDEPREPPASGSAGEAQRSISVKLFFSATQAPGLVLEDREVAFSPDLARQLRTVVEELVQGLRGGPLADIRSPRPRSSMSSSRLAASRTSTFPRRPRRATSAGLTRSCAASIPSSTRITANFPAIHRVQILVDDKPAVTLAGHVDLSRPLPPDMTLLAASILTPVEPEAPGVPAPTPLPSPAS